MGIVYIIKSSFTKVSVVILTQCRGPDQSCLAAIVISNQTACFHEKDFLSQLGWLRPTLKKTKAKQKRGCKIKTPFPLVQYYVLKTGRAWMEMCPFRKITAPPQPARVMAWQTWWEQPCELGLWLVCWKLCSCSSSASLISFRER